METLEVLAPNEKRCSKCKEVKDRSEFLFNKENKDGLMGYCKVCHNTRAREKRAKNRKCLICPICGQYCIWLSPHLNKIHGLNKSEFANLGITQTMADSERIGRGVRLKKPHMSMRKGEVVVISKYHITFPREFWPVDCRYVKFIVSKKDKTVHLKPYLRNSENTRSVYIPPEGPNGHRIRLNAHNILLTSLDVERDIRLVAKTEKKGFIIQFSDKDDPLLEAFHVWSNFGLNKTNISDLTTYSHTKQPTITISAAIWPDNANYAIFSLHRTNRTNSDDYIEVTPCFGYVFRAGMVKAVRRKNRYLMSPAKFIKESMVPSGDWDLKEVLPSGALRFRLYKERQPRGQSEEDIAS
jgi:hypothetical protein